MPLFDAIGIAGTSLTVHRKWMDAIADNLSNMNDATRTTDPAFQQRYVVARPISAENGGGTQVAGIVYGDAQGREVYEPDNPLADANGMVRYPDIDLSGQMTQLIMAQRGYEMNLAVIDRAKDAYQQALQLGR